MPGVYDVPLFDLNFDGREPAAAAKAVESGWISMGPRTAELEARFAAHLDTGHAVAVGSCTAALHIAVMTLVEPGSEVIVPSLTFVATVNAIRYVGATPVFADVIGVNDFSIDPKDVSEKITDKTRALIPMHFGGFPCPMEELVSITEDHGLEIIEDAAHSPGTRYKGKALGTFGRAGCFSFFSNKNMTCAEGGMLVTDDPRVAAHARLLRSHGMTTLSYSRAEGHAVSYDVIEAGFNYRLDDIRAAIAIVQLEKLPADLERRRRVREWYLARLADERSIVIPYGGVKESSNYIMPIVLKTGGARRRDAVRKLLATSGIQTSVHYPAVHRFETYRGTASRLPKTEHIADHEITLPMYGALRREQVDRVCTALLEALEETS